MEGIDFKIYEEFNKRILNGDKYKKTIFSSMFNNIYLFNLFDRLFYVRKNGFFDILLENKILSITIKAKKKSLTTINNYKSSALLCAIIADIIDLPPKYIVASLLQYVAVDCFSTYIDIDTEEYNQKLMRILKQKFLQERNQIYLSLYDIIEFGTDSNFVNEVIRILTDPNDILHCLDSINISFLSRTLINYYYFKPIEDTIYTIFNVIKNLTKYEFTNDNITRYKIFVPKQNSYIYYIIYDIYLYSYRYLSYII